MADIVLSPWKLGIDQVSTDTNLPHGAVRDAVNVDIDRAGTIGSRAGYAVAQSLVGAHSLWTSEIRGESFCVAAGVLSLVNGDSTLTALHTLSADEPLSYDDLNGDVVFSNRAELGAITPDLSVRPLGVEDPSQPAVSGAAGIGGFYAGTYGVAISYLRGAEESAVSPAAFATLADGDGLSIALPQPVDSAVTSIRIYRTQANGDAFYRASDAPVGMSPYVIGIGNVGRQANTRFMQRLRGGQIVRYWRGHLLVARGKNLLFSSSLRYGLHDPTKDFVQFPHKIRLMEPVEGGVFVGTADGVVFESGESPNEWKQRRTGGEAPVAGTGRRIETSILGGDRDYGGAYAALWLAGNGFVVGTADGSLIQAQAKRIRLPDNQLGGAGALVVHDREIVASIS